MTPELAQFMARCLLSIALQTILQNILIGVGIYLVLRRLGQLTKRMEER